MRVGYCQVERTAASSFSSSRSSCSSTAGASFCFSANLRFVKWLFPLLRVYEIVISLHLDGESDDRENWVRIHNSMYEQVCVPIVCMCVSIGVVILPFALTASIVATLIVSS